jgi:acyl-CoA reductase-like NAD-dependent aldehyde dehydrogenase
VTGFVAGAEGEGARASSSTAASSTPAGRVLHRPSLVDGVTPGMRVYDEEIFGPVLSVVRVATYDDAVALINDNRYANGTAVFTRDGKTARQFEFDIEVGMVGVNVPIPCRSARSRSAAGRTRSSATRTCTGRRRSTSTRAARSSRRAGPTEREPDQPRLPDALRG